MSIQREAKEGLLQNLAISTNTAVQGIKNIENRKDISAKDKLYLECIYNITIALASTATAYILDRDDSLIVSGRAN